MTTHVLTRSALIALALQLTACSGLPELSTMSASIDGSPFSVKGPTQTSAQLRDVDGVYVEGQDAAGRLIVLRFGTTLGTHPLMTGQAQLCYSAYSCVSVTGGTFTLTEYKELSHARGTFSFYGHDGGRMVEVTDGTFDVVHGINGTPGYD